MSLLLTRTVAPLYQRWYINMRYHDDGDSVKNN